ncbi:MAG: YCF48-related protein [Pyrinomonadaceae bacterium]
MKVLNLHFVVILMLGFWFLSSKDSYAQSRMTLAQLNTQRTFIEPGHQPSFTAMPYWTMETSGVTARLRGISAVDDRVAWASGSGNTVLRTTDGGQTWTKLTVTNSQKDPLDFRDIDAIDARTAYVLSIGNGPASRIYKTSDGGQTWTLQFKGEDPKEFWDAMSFWDAVNGIVLGDSVNGQFCIMTTSNGGRTWTRVPAAVLPPALENEGAFAASGTNIAVWGKSHAWLATGAGAKARVLRTADRGRTWKVSETPLMAGPSSGIFSIAFRDAKHGVIAGGDYTKEKEAVNNLAMTSDGGVTWTLVKGLSGFRSAVAYIPVMSPGQTPALVALGPSGTDFSIDDGHTWVQLEGPGFDTLSFARHTARGLRQASPVGWAAGAKGSIARFATL